MTLEHRYLKAEQFYKESVRSYNRGHITLATLDKVRNDYLAIIEILNVRQGKVA